MGRFDIDTAGLDQACQVHGTLDSGAWDRFERTGRLVEQDHGAPKMIRTANWLDQHVWLPVTFGVIGIICWVVTI